jgi:tetratricopeptide (TPR) repeat protein
MRGFWSFLISLSFTTQAFALGGDSIRSFAPMTALILDARANYADPLIEAYFDREVDFFLDFENVQNSTINELRTLREAGRALERSDYMTAEQKIAGIQRFPSDKKYLRGVLEAARGRYQQSLEQFRQLIDDRLNVSRRLQNLAFMGAARVFHEVGDYKQAIYHYNQVRQLDSEFFQAVFEKGWSFYLNGDMNGSLGVSLSFLSPYFDSAFYPEAWVVRAASFFQLCYFDRATATVEEMKRRFEPVQRQARELLNREPSSFLFDDRILKAVNKGLLGFLTSDSRFRSLMRAQLALSSEVKALQGRREQALASSALASVRSRLAQEARRVLTLADKQVSDLLAQADLIAIEILQAAANQILGRPPEEQAQVKIINLGEVDFDEMVQFWPFQSEFWLDELGSYYYGLKSNCDSETEQSSIIPTRYGSALQHFRAQF